MPDPGQGEGKGEALIKTFNATHVEKMVTSHEIAWTRGNKDEEERGAEMGNHLNLGEGEVTQGQDPGHDHQDKAKIASQGHLLTNTEAEVEVQGQDHQDGIDPHQDHPRIAEVEKTQKETEDQ